MRKLMVAGAAGDHAAETIHAGGQPRLALDLTRVPSGQSPPADTADWGHRIWLAQTQYRRRTRPVTMPRGRSA
jgi:hypothetical protein